MINIYFWLLEALYIPFLEMGIFEFNTSKALGDNELFSSGRFASVLIGLAG